jgi:hypothetical protein
METNTQFPFFAKKGFDFVILLTFKKARNKEIIIMIFLINLSIVLVKKQILQQDQKE